MHAAMGGWHAALGRVVRCVLMFAGPEVTRELCCCCRAARAGNS
jgi:hypothetical protein